jgi:hypothetical protein
MKVSELTRMEYPTPRGGDEELSNGASKKVSSSLHVQPTSRWLMIFRIEKSTFSISGGESSVTEYIYFQLVHRDNADSDRY